MIGSGFSLNGVKRAQSVPSFPTWAALSKRLIDRLAPPCSDCVCFTDPAKRPASTSRQCDGNPRYRRQLLAESTGTSGAMRLAQKFEARFQRADLENFLRAAVPDHDYDPGPVHQELVRLPWADIFTTNWDTMLERAIDHYDRSYTVVNSVTQIPLSPAPRIVKLHGTLDAGTQLIFTEEDFRTYPRRFAAFITMVQQSMMENIFVLIGFSGEDQNFLNWHGWVRDQLGENLQPVYLVMLDQPDKAERLLLRSRRVTPLAIGSLLENPKRLAPSERFRQAYKIFFQMLRAEQEVERLNLNWPEVIKSSFDKPSLEATLSPAPEHLFTNKQTVQYVLEYWQNRFKSQPDWLSLPEPNGGILWDRLMGDYDVLRAGLTSADEELHTRVAAAGVLVELHERCLGIFSENLALALAKVIAAAGDQPLSDAESASLEQVIAKLFDPKSGGFAAGLQSGDAIGDQVSAIAITLLRYCRHRRWDGPFDAIAAALQREMGPKTSDVLAYERSCHYLLSQNVGLARAEVANWEPEWSEIDWVLRKAGLVEEMGDARLAEGLIRTCIERARQEGPKRNGSKRPSGLWEASREGWAYLKYRELLTQQRDQLYAEVARRSGGVEYDHIRQELVDRLDELSSMRCDPRPILDHIRHEVIEWALERGAAQKGPGASPPALIGGTDCTGASEDGLATRRNPGYAFLRVAEVAGLPPRSFKDGRRPVKPLMLTAACILPPEMRSLARDLMLRTAYGLEELCSLPGYGGQIFDEGQDSPAEVFDLLKQRCDILAESYREGLPDAGYIAVRMSFLVALIAGLIGSPNTPRDLANTALAWVRQSLDRFPPKAVRESSLAWRRLLAALFRAIGPQGLMQSLRDLLQALPPQRKAEPVVAADWPDPVAVILQDGGLMTSLTEQARGLSAEDRGALEQARTWFGPSDGDDVAHARRRMLLDRLLQPGLISA